MNFKYYKTERLILLIIGLAVILGALSTWINHLISNIPGPLATAIIFTDSFTVPFFITIIIYLINNYLWKSNKFKWLIDIPNLNGRYVGKLESSYVENGKKKILDCVIEISQSASSIHICGYFGDITKDNVSSTSISTSETIVEEKNGFFRLYYIFTNETGGIPEKLNNHSGTAKFLYYPDKKMLDGDYYNKLQNVGLIKVSFQQEKLIGRLTP